MKFLHFFSYDILTVDQVADASVEGILRNEFEISIPKNMHVFIKIFQLCPSILKNFIRDKIRKESEMFQVKGVNL
jgi:short-subunit dehydrogenase